MKYLKILFFSFIFFAGQNAHANVYNVSFNSLQVPIGVNAQYIEVHTWYPTEGRVLLRTIEREGRQFSLARNSAPIAQDLNLIIISTPSFTNSYDFSSFAYSLARRGFLVAVITHLNDNKENMLYSLSGWQLVWRAAQIKTVIEHLNNESPFSIKQDNISSISFGETALAPILLDNFVLDTESYSSFCIQTENDPFCLPPYNMQIANMIQSIDLYAKDSAKKLETFEAESKKVRTENTKLQTEWDKATQRAMRYNEQLPEAPTWLELPLLPIEADLNAPYIKNYFFVEPLLPFVVQSAGQSLRKLEIFNISSKNPTIANTSIHSLYVQNLFQHRAIELNLDKYNYLDLLEKNQKQRKVDNLIQPDLLSSISSREQTIFIESFVKNISENILNF